MINVFKHSLFYVGELNYFWISFISLYLYLYFD